MKKFFFFSKAYWLVTLFAMLSLSVFATKTGGCPTGDINGATCMPINGTQSYTGVVYTSDPCEVVETHWVTRGDLGVVVPAGEYSATVLSVNKNPYYNDAGYGKGRLVFYYTFGGPDCPCPTQDSVYIDIYKDFYAPEAHEIIGPECIQQGDTVIFSYRPIVTVNVNEMIGIDSYFWDLSNVSVDTLLYFAGDSSSVTFVAGNVQDGEEIRLNVGRCNTASAKTLTLPLFKKAPQPIVSDICEPLGAHAVTVGVENPASGVNYTWFLESQYNTPNNTGSSITVNLDQSTSAMIIAQASLPNSTASCASNYDTMMVYRSFDQNIAIIESQSCVAVTSAEQYVTYSVQASSSCNWDIPAGWVFKPNTIINSSTIFIKPTSAALLRDTVKVQLYSCSDTTLSKLVYVKPGKLPQINGLTCVTRNEEYVYYIDATATLPVATDYTWTVPAGWEWTYGATHDTIYVTPKGNTIGNISVTPRGLNNCNGEATTLAVKFSPQQPTGININKTCINSGMEDNIVLTTEGVGSGQLYQWFIPEELGSIQGSAAGNSVAVTTSGIDDSYTVGVLAYNEGCGQTDTITEAVEITNQGYTYTYNEASNNTYYLINITGTEWPQSRLYTNGVEIPNATVNTPNMILVLIPSIGDIDTSSVYTLVIENITMGGCTVRKTLGVPLEGNNSLRSSSAGINLLSTQVAPTQFASVYPNPVSNMLNIDIQQTISSPINILVVDMNGSIVTSMIANSPNVQIDTSSWSTGSYIISFQMGGEFHRQIVIKQ
jgi:hypothetical protein